MEKIEGILGSLTKSINQSIKDFSECKDLSQKKVQAEIIKLLCESMDVFFNAMSNSAYYPLDDFDVDDYDEDDEDYEIEKPRKTKKTKKKSNKDDIPF